MFLFTVFNVATSKFLIENVTHIIFLLDSKTLQETLAWSPNLVHRLFLYILKAKKSFYSFKALFKKKKKSCYRDCVASKG